MIFLNCTIFILKFLKGTKDLQTTERGVKLYVLSSLEGVAASWGVVDGVDESTELTLVYIFIVMRNCRFLLIFSYCLNS